MFEFWSGQKAITFPPFSLIVHDSAHNLYKTHCNGFIISTGYLYFWSCLKFSTTANELMNSPFSIYVAVPRQRLLVTKRLPSASKQDRMPNLCRKSVSTSSICVHFIRFVQRKNKQLFFGGGGVGAADKWHAFLVVACSSLRSKWLRDRQTDSEFVLNNRRLVLIDEENPPSIEPRAARAQDYWHADCSVNIHGFSCKSRTATFR